MKNCRFEHFLAIDWSGARGDKQKGIALAHFATAWVLANAAVSAVIAGPRTFEQWTDYFGALDVAIDRKSVV